ncbi:hypothetical protein GY45DRAFT_554300 [Cubamyces sp. BRFM 1775]|nr:hypothetical protein GY45DRAFT_554300 [Cubamyces sp. BRFM 1775]
MAGGRGRRWWLRAKQRWALVDSDTGHLVLVLCDCLRVLLLLPLVVCRRHRTIRFQRLRWKRPLTHASSYNGSTTTGIKLASAACLQLAFENCASALKPTGTGRWTLTLDRFLLSFGTADYPQISRWRLVPRCTRQ